MSSSKQHCLYGDSTMHKEGHDYKPSHRRSKKKKNKAKSTCPEMAIHITMASDAERSLVQATSLLKAKHWPAATAGTGVATLAMP